MTNEVLRLKIQFLIEPSMVDSIFKDPNFTNFWYCLETNKLELVEQLKKDICLKLLNKNSIDYRSIYILIDNFEVPSFESTRIFRDNDLIQICLKTNFQISKKRKFFEPLKENKKPHLESDLAEVLADKTVQIVKPFEAALIGTSMIKHLDPNKIFENKKCFFKSISGGRISDIIEFVKKREGFFDNCQFICLTCGSNDCDSYNDIQTTIQRCIDLATYLHSKYPQSNLIFNELIPRLKTKYIDLDLFEKRRICFNNFLNSSLKMIVSCKIVKHEEFEDKSKLEFLLTDGVHINPIDGVSKYIQDIKKILKI